MRKVGPEGKPLHTSVAIGNWPTIRKTDLDMYPLPFLIISNVPCYIQVDIYVADDSLTVVGCEPCITRMGFVLYADGRYGTWPEFQKEKMNRCAVCHMKYGETDCLATRWHENTHKVDSAFEKPPPSG